MNDADRLALANTGYPSVNGLLWLGLTKPKSAAPAEKPAKPAKGSKAKAAKAKA